MSYTDISLGYLEVIKFYVSPRFKKESFLILAIMKFISAITGEIKGGQENKVKKRSLISFLYAIN